MWPFSSTPKWRIDESRVKDNLFFDLAGLRFYGLNKKPELFNKLRIRDVLNAQHEPDNPIDKNALAVFAPKDIKLGHVPKVICRHYEPFMEKGTQYVAISKLERTVIKYNGIEAPLYAIGVHFPEYEDSSAGELEYKPYGFLTGYKGH
jgi:hypothetical protein